MNKARLNSHDSQSFMERARSRARGQELNAWMYQISPCHCMSWFLCLNNWIGNSSIPEVNIRIKLDNEGEVIFQNTTPLPKYCYCHTDKHLGVFHTCSLPSMCEELCICYTESSQSPWKLGFIYPGQVKKQSQ